jgi:hypothetical protein
MTDRRDEIAAELERGLAETVLFFRSLSPDEDGVAPRAGVWIGIPPQTPKDCRHQKSGGCSTLLSPPPHQPLLFDAKYP